jgi:hypothetical protein
VRLPFTLTPAPGQDLAEWLDAYASRLGVTAGELADAVGLPDHLADPGRPPDPKQLEQHVENLCAATGLADHAVRALLSPAAPTVENRREPVGLRSDLSVIERLRHATAIGHDARLQHATAIRRRRGHVSEGDPAIERARRLPNQIWPAWAIRLVDSDAFEPMTFRPSMLAALLIPHSGLTLREIAALVHEQVRPGSVGHHLRKLVHVTGDATVLQVLTELAFAVDTHEIPIDYSRRRQVVAGRELIDPRTWADLARDADARPGGQRRWGYARSYLYELITGCNLHLAPAPYRIAPYEERILYHDFVVGLPRSLVEALHHHAQRILHQAGICGEPLQWEPPSEWVTVTNWPGADPARTDPERIHRGLLAPRSAHRRLAKTLGISTEHLRHVVRQHPRLCPAYPNRRVLVPTDSDGEHTDEAVYLDPAWLHEEYVTWRRPLAHIATQIGCNVAVLKKFAHEQGIPLRPQSGPKGFAHLDVPGLHPYQIPEPLRSALTGRGARARLERFVVLVDQPSLTQAARTIGIPQCVLTLQLQHIERACGGPLLHRRGCPHPMGPLTPLGEQLHRQTLQHLKLSPSP